MVADCKELFEIHKNDENGVLPKKYRREQIIGSKLFTPVERDFLDWLLVEDEYYMDEVKELVRREMERVIE